MSDNRQLAPWEEHRKFVPGYMDDFGDFHPLPRSERWGDIMYEIDEQIRLEKEQKKRGTEVAKQAAYKGRERNLARENPELHGQIQAQIAELRRLNALARAAPQNVAAPKEGDFKKDAQGKLYRWTSTPYWQIVKTGPENAPAAIPSPREGNIKKVDKKFYKWTTTPSWREVRRETNYNLDLADTYARTDRLGKAYLNARDFLYQELYPGQAPIRRPKHLQRRSTRRRSNRRNRTRKS